MPLDDPIPALDGEAQLVAALRAGQPAAFESLVRSEGGNLLTVARRYLPREEDAKDAVQDAFLQAFRHIDQFNGEARLSTWLHRIAVNAALMKRRARLRRPEQPIEPLLPAWREDGHSQRPPAVWRADARLERRENRELVRKAIDELPESYRNVLLLRDIEELDTAETARLLQISEGAVKTRLHRARQALRTLLEPHFAGDLS
jgi:RNA polymerase sigma-70 factor (ECF subfamily)